MDQSIGSLVSVECGEKGYFQGIISEIVLNANPQVIILAHPFKNGLPCGKIQRIEVTTIKDLKILKTANSIENAPTTSRTTNPPINNNSKKTHKSGSYDKSIKTLMKRTAPSLTTDETSLKDCSTSSDPESRSSRENKHKSIKKRTKSSRPLEDFPLPLESTPTPLFKRFEPQIPKPQSLTVPNWALRSAKKGRGPCGIPILDVQNGYGPISRRDAHLGVPIDLDELAIDFDFQQNLNLFDKDNVNTDDDESVEKSKMSNNFKHDENILSDPSRITSWTNVTAKNCYSADDLSSVVAVSCNSPSQMSFCPSSFLKVSNGFKIPVLDETVKAKFLKSCQLYLNCSSFSSLVADRIILYFQELLSNILRHALKIVILSNSSTKEIAGFLSSRLGSRGHSVYVFGDVGDTGGVKYIRVQNVKLLPPEPDLVLTLSKEIPLELISYLDLYKNSQIISLESRPPVMNLSNVHILMLGTFTSGIFVLPSSLPVGKTTFAALCGAVVSSTNIDCRVADIGAPFEWIVDGGKEALSNAFSRDVLVSLY